MMRSLFSFVFRIVSFIRSHAFTSTVGLIVVLGSVGVVSALFLQFLPGGPPVDVIEPKLSVITKNQDPLPTTYTGAPIASRSLALYQISNHIRSQQLLAVFAQRLGLQQSTFLKTVYVSADNQISLAQDTNIAQSAYTNLQNTPTEVLALAEAEKTARTFLQQIGYPENELTRKEEATEFFVNHPPHLEPASPETATAIRLAFRRTIQDLPIYVSGSEWEAATVTVTKTGAFKAELPSLFFQTEKRQTIKTLPSDTAISAVQEGKYHIVSQLQPAIWDGVTLSQLQQLSLTSGQLEYRLDETQNLLLPYYEFSGTVTAKNGQSSPIILITPAFSESILK